MLLTLDKGYLLIATPPDLERGVAPLGPPLPMQPPLLRRGVANLNYIFPIKCGSISAQILSQKLSSASPKSNNVQQIFYNYNVIKLTS